MKHTFTLLLFLLATQVNAQSFMYDLFFEDSLGNKDTVTVGFDATATNGIDSSFGEVDLSNIPWDTNGIEVRVFTNNGIETKKSIQDPYFFFTCYHTHWQEVGVYTKHWPITVSWDSTQFTGCSGGYGIANWPPVPAKTCPGLGEQEWQWYDYDEYSFGTFLNSTPIECSENGIYSTNAPDSAKALTIVYEKLSSINEIAKSVSLFPNPAYDKVQVELNTGLKSIDWVIYSVTGQVIHTVQTSQNNPTLHLTGIPNGTYVLIGQSDDEFYRQKLMILKN